MRKRRCGTERRCCRSNGERIRGWRPMRMRRMPDTRRCEKRGEDRRGCGANRVARARRNDSEVGGAGRSQRAHGLGATRRCRSRARPEAPRIDAEAAHLHAPTIERDARRGVRARRGSGGARSAASSRSGRAGEDAGGGLLREIIERHGDAAFPLPWSAVSESITVPLAAARRWSRDYEIPFSICEGARSSRKTRALRGAKGVMRFSSHADHVETMDGRRFDFPLSLGASNEERAALWSEG